MITKQDAALDAAEVVATAVRVLADTLLTVAITSAVVSGAGE